MMLHVESVLGKDEVAACRDIILAADWVDGNLTSGPQAALAKKNRQLDEESPAARKASALVLAALARSAVFFAAALPLKIWPPMFNRYGVGDKFATHVDNAVRIDRARALHLRSDLSATLFLSEPQDYEGGELLVEDTYGAHEVKLAAGDLILYPASSLHHVEPITRGERLASFFWIQSMVREDARRALLFEMDIAIQKLARAVGNKDEAIVSLTGSYHNLLRHWAET